MLFHGKAEQHAHRHGPTHRTREGGAVRVQPLPGICIQRFALLRNSAAETGTDTNSIHILLCRR